MEDFADDSGKISIMREENTSSQRLVLVLVNTGIIVLKRIFVVDFKMLYKEGRKCFI